MRFTLFMRLGCVCRWGRSKIFGRYPGRHYCGAARNSPGAPQLRFSSSRKCLSEFLAARGSSAASFTRVSKYETGAECSSHTASHRHRLRARRSRVNSLRSRRRDRSEWHLVSEPRITGQWRTRDVNQRAGSACGTNIQRLRYLMDWRCRSTVWLRTVYLHGVMSTVCLKAGRIEIRRAPQGTRFCTVSPPQLSAAQIAQFTD